MSSGGEFNKLVEFVQSSYYVDKQLNEFDKILTNFKKSKEAQSSSNLPQGQQSINRGTEVTIASLFPPLVNPIVPNFTQQPFLTTSDYTPSKSQTDFMSTTFHRLDNRNTFPVESFIIMFKFLQRPYSTDLTDQQIADRYIHFITSSIKVSKKVNTWMIKTEIDLVRRSFEEYKINQQQKQLEVLKLIKKEKEN